MESEKKDTPSLRGSRGARGRGMANVRERAAEKSPSPKPSQEKRESSKPEQVESNQGNKNTNQNSRTGRRGQNRQIHRRNRRMRQPNRNNRRLERAQNALRNQSRNQRGNYRPRRGFYSMRRRTPFGRRSIFIAGLPRFVTRFRLFGMLRKEGRCLRCSLLRDRFGRSRGIAFAEMQNPRDAWKIIQNYRGREVFGNTIFVTFKRNPNRWNYNRNNNRFWNNRQFNNYNPRYQRPFRPNRGNYGRGRGRGRGRNFQ